jgi:hypothetical protein
VTQKSFNDAGNVEVEALPEAISLPPGFGLTVTESAKSPLWLSQRFLVGRLVKLQAPNPKLQRSSKLQIPEASRAARPACHRRPLVQHEGPVVLELGACNFFGIWSFGDPEAHRRHGCTTQSGDSEDSVTADVPRRSRGDALRTRSSSPCAVRRSWKLSMNLFAVTPTFQSALLAGWKPRYEGSWPRLRQTPGTAWHYLSRSRRLYLLRGSVL